MSQPGTNRTVTVAAIGLPETEVEVLGRIFALSARRKFAYRLAPAGSESAAEIVLIDQARPGAIDTWRAALLAANPKRPVPIAVADNRPPRCTYHARRPMMATRVLGLLDRVVEERLTGKATVTAARGAASTPPRQPPPASTRRAPETPSENLGDARYHALVVDDSRAVRKQISIALDAEKVTADYADSGERALELLDDKPYDIVFLDVMMPGMDGYDVCKSVKRDREKRHIPIVMLTGKSSPFDRVKGKLAGCDSYLTKPVKRDDFVSTIKKYLKEPIAF